ncbi:hypothetical protein LEP1GSC133_2138 [Leptospira borgpetersenii serovar Pomona str. 200901868]|uniref:Uncharacterized protein n=1 Tax=Leptospira borgpetersenii serovar Pomona str. 200901868 TaxID=1192866 RepID=M6W0H5_LEPBO|nr:hypothetical protein LEP1GSC133_2138 [Leptospira borgpetersenii serovar Pomona str. 200901868]
MKSFVRGFTSLKSNCGGYLFFFFFTGADFFLGIDFDFAGFKGDEFF